LADITGAFGFMTDGLYFLLTSHVFGSNTSASSWEPLRQSIKEMIPVHMETGNLVKRHKELLVELKWEEPPNDKIITTISCPINPGVLETNEKLKPPISNIYNDDILSAVINGNYMKNCWRQPSKQS
jgi:hypothetical protein